MATAITAAVGLLGVLWIVRASGVPVLNPIYQIETESNGYKASLPLNLGQPGVPVLPRPVDVNGDGIFDIQVAVNLVDVRSLLDTPLNPGPIFAPNVEIARDPAGVALCKADISLLSKCSPPLKILVKFTVKDSSNLEEDQVISFGYDTGNNGTPPGCATGPCTDKKGRIGSIPPYFQAVLFGLEDFYNPLTAMVTTRGYEILGVAGVDVESRTGYEGPLDIVGTIGDAPGLLAPGGGFSLSQLLDRLLDLINPDDDVASDIRLGYRPWPGDISVTYATDEEGQHIVYDHSRREEVDVNTHIGLFEREEDVLTSDVIEARVDRMPRHVELDLSTADRTGEIRYEADADGRLPDVSLSALSEKLQVIELPAPPPDPLVEARLRARLLGYQVKAHAALFVGLNEENPPVQLVPIEAPLLADVDIEALPAVMEGRWSFPTGGPVSALFCGGEVDDADACTPNGTGVGAVDARVADFYAAPTTFGPFRPTEQQFLSFQSAPGGAFETESLVSGRIDQIRELRFEQSTEGFSARTRIGDGELPLEMHFSADLRDGEEGALVNLGATVLPVPDDLTVVMKSPGEDQQARPLELTYISSKSVDVNSHVDVRLVGAGPTCGTAGTICGDLNARHIPARIDVRVKTFPTQVTDIAPPDKLFPESRVDIDTVPRLGGTLPDFFANLTLGLEDDTPTNFADDVPLVAQAELLGLPRFVRVRTREGNDETLDRFEFHTCDRQFDAAPPVCTAGTDQPIKSLSVKLRNWTARPSGLPILVPGTPLWATMAVRGRPATTDVDFEAAARLTDVAEVQYRNTGRVFGIRSRVGADQDFSAKVDMGNVDFPDDDPSNGRIDAQGDVLIEPLPGEMDFCFRSAHEVIQTLSDAFTDPCETNNPFNDADENGDPVLLTETPTTVAYDGNGPFDVIGNVLLRQRGLSAGVADDHTIRGTLGVDNLPSRVTVNFQAPKDDGDDVVEEGEEGPLRGILDAAPGEPVVVTLSAAVTDGDLVCEDPRTPALDKKAMCLSGRVEDLPTQAFFRYDPTVKTDNFEIRTNSEINVRDLVLSSVEGVRKSDDETSPDYNVIVPKILLARGQVLGLPNVVTGTLDLPKKVDEDSDVEEAPTVDITADPPIQEVQLTTVQNFIAPDPFIQAIPTRTVSGFGTPIQFATFRQRGASFKATATIRDVAGVGYRTVKDAEGKPLETKVIRVDFGQGNHVIRGYADIMENPGSQTIADVLLNNIPAGLSVCFRGKPNPVAPGPGEATYCDVGDEVVPLEHENGAEQDSGAIQFEGSPDSPADSPLDVDGFVRHASGGGTQVLAARIHVDDIPFVVQGTIPLGADEGNLDVGGFRRDADGDLVPDGINRIEINAATFDLATADTGFVGTLPYEPRFNDNDPFPATGSSNQHLKALLKDEDFHIRGRIGPQSQVQRVQMVRSPCPRPDFVSDTYPYPHFPVDDPDTAVVEDASKYTCIKGVFNPSVTDSDPAGGFDDQLDVQLYMEEAGEVISLANAGLTDIPSKVQMTIAETEPFESNAAADLRDRCGLAPQPPDTDCMPPLLQFDQPQESILFGTLRKGTVGDVAALDATGLDAIAPRPGEDLASLEAVPTATSYPGWESPPSGLPANLGARAKIVGFKGDRTAVKAGFRLKLPRSLTVDQVQSWSDSSRSGVDGYWEASDTRFHYIVRNSAGNPVGSLGQATLLKQSDDGTQILVSAPCLSSYGPRAHDPGDCDAFQNGIPIPGEMGIDIYQRNHTGHGKDFIQIDGRVSQLTNTSGNPIDMNLGVRVVGGGPKPSIGRLEGQVLDVPQVGSGVGAGDPSFRLRVEMIGEGEAPPEAGGGGGGGGEEENCSIFLCALTDVRIKSIFTSFDFQSARKVEAVVRQGGATTQGVEVKSFTSINGDTPTPIKVKALLDVNPINVFLHAGLPLIGGADFVLLSQLQAAVTLDTQHFTLRHNTLHVEADNSGPNKSVIGPINYYIYLMHGSAYALFVKLFGVDFIPTSDPPEFGLAPGPPNGPVQLVFLSCDASDLFTQLTDIVDTVVDPFGGNPLSNALEVGSAGRNVVMWPFLDPRIHFSGAFGFLGNIAKLIGPFFCFTDTSPENIPLFEDGVPGDPVGTARMQGHDLPPGAVEDETPIPGPPPTTIDPPPSFNDSGDFALCGTHSFTDLTIDNTLTVATSPSTTDTTGTGADCPADSVGTLNVVADEVTVNGSIFASGIIDDLQPISPPTLPDGGGGHGGGGGDGGQGGNGGGTYDDVDEDGPDNDDDTDDDGTATLVGGRGRGSGFGNGGGSIEIQANDVIVNGQIVARGGDGDDGASGDADCTGATGGAGGGSGGRIVIDAFNIDNNGTISVSGGFGGNGGDGGGGGGGAGRLEIQSPLMSGASGVFGAGRDGGTDTCTDNGDDDGDDGGDWDVDEHIDTLPKSTVLPLTKFWNRDESSEGANLSLNYVAAADDGGDDGVQVLICGRKKTPQEIADAPQGTDLNSLFPVPDPIFSPFLTFVDMCGGQQRIVVDSFTADRRTASVPTQGSDLDSGYWGLWSIAFKPPDSDYNCLEDLNALLVCDIEPLPEFADLVIGIDNINPRHGSDDDNPGQIIDEPGDDFPTNSTKIKVVVNAIDQAELSNLSTVECSNNGTDFVDCQNGENTWFLSSGGDGNRTITVRATDFAGNTTTSSRTGLLDRQIPNTTASLSGGTLGGGGWYRVRPTVNLSGTDPVPASGFADPEFRYRFDDGEEESCAGSVFFGIASCDINQADVDALFVGEHVLHFTGVDRAGNRLFDVDPDDPDPPPHPMSTKPVKIDDEKPLSAFLTVPRVPNGANGWYAGRPFVTFSAVDQPGASGFNSAAAGVFYSKVGPGGPFTKFNGVPFPLEPGSHNFCWYAVDVAGNQENTHCTTEPLRVDDAAPAVSINAPAPDGLNGWYKTVPTVTVATTDAAPGSSVNPAFDPDRSDLCTGKIAAPNPLIPSGTCLSIDGGPYAPQPAGPINIAVQEGLHEIRAFAVDVSGQRSPVVASAFMVDRSEPVTAARLIPPAPALDPWWRRLPRAVLRATDGERNAGVQKIEYRLDSGAWTAYTGAFEIPAGVHSVTYRAYDLSGRVEAIRTLPVSVDTGPAVVRATSSQPLAFIPAKGQKAKLRWTVVDDLSKKVRPVVIVYNARGKVVRRIQDITRTITPGVTTTFETVWDGKEDGLGAVIVPVGLYYYRVVIVDEAGNISQSGESQPLTVKIG
jgi:hypothetical protein